MQRFLALAPGAVHRVTEGNGTPQSTPFRTRAPYQALGVSGKNVPQPADTWLLEPVPTPEHRKGPGFVVLHAGQPLRYPSDLPVELVDLTREKEDVAATWSLFRRYLFEYRQELSVPLTILIDEQSRARRIYAEPPSEATMRKDLQQVSQSAKLALPFAGRYFSEPRRNYFKLGAAFYWAGYPDRALPYLEETVRSRPDNWKALLAAGRIHQELGRDREAIDAFQRVLAIRPDYAPAMVNIGESRLKLNDNPAARASFLDALKADPKCADAANQLGLLAAEAGDSDTARQRFQQAIEAQRDHTGAINNLGVLYARLGRAQDSIAAFRYGLQMDPDDEQLYLNLARIYVTMGERDQARAVLTQLMDRKPGNALAAKALSQLEAR
jgi:tetratricopeptide (TPR) repeat protein